ncbi:hypothetical protein AJ79_05150 [Helicocarpus griseus UAMH5409]|uniref:Phosphotransferase n=1 Tax=Helicocarpus griseus UAMH5409 TaxID=1447875 RepID=A0A2B7XPV8_9EURO|nr:hypothetical protein AJ79_05150 [Helicocarpus griseus UAMH5409]
MDDTKNPRIDNDFCAFLKPLEIPEDTLYSLSHRFSKTYQDLAANSLEQFFPIPITNLPTGKEVGRYLAAYVGLYYLRVSFIELLGDAAQEGNPNRPRVKRILEKAWPIESRLKKNHAGELFSWIGDCIAEIVTDRLEGESKEWDEPRELEMGISFCFPIKQDSLDEAVLVPTGKGFALNTHLDLRQALLDGYECHVRRSRSPSPGLAKRAKTHALPKLRITAMVNDTVATFASLAYSIRSLPNTRVVMGLLLGAGCNATVPMLIDDLHESKVRHIRLADPKAVETLVTTEWTLRAASEPLSNLNLITSWDSQLNASGDRPGFQPLEYMIAGRYLGELVRIIVHDYFHRILAISKEDLPDKLMKPYALTTEFLSLVVAPSQSGEELLADLERELPSPPLSGWKWTPSLADIVRATTTKIQRRAASLIAAASVGLLACTREIKLADLKEGKSVAETPVVCPSAVPTADPIALPHRSPGSNSPPKVKGQNNPEELVIAFSGGLIQHWPGFRESIQWHIDRLVLRGGPQELGKSIFLREVSDGGLVGVGVLAGTLQGSIEGIVGSVLD